MLLAKRNDTDNVVEVSQDACHEIGTYSHGACGNTASTVAHTAEMADGVANGGGLCQGKDGAGGGVPVVGDWAQPVVSTEVALVGYGGEETQA